MIIEIPGNATNGDVVKAAFPNAKVTYIRKMSGVPTSLLQFYSEALTV